MIVIPGYYSHFCTLVPKMIYTVKLKKKKVSKADKTINTHTTILLHLKGTSLNPTSVK